MGLNCMEKFCGQIVSKEQLDEIIEIIETFPNVGRTELASTICEFYSWKRCNGKPKSVECRQFLERLSVSSFPNWVHSEQRRNWEFQNGNLLLSAQGLQVGNEKVGAYLIWKRAKVEHDI